MITVTKTNKGIIVDWGSLEIAPQDVRVGFIPYRRIHAIDVVTDSEGNLTDFIRVSLTEYKELAPIPYNLITIKDTDGQDYTFNSALEVLERYGA